MRKFGCYAIILALVPTCSNGFGQTLKVAGETKVLAYKFVELRADGAAPEAAILWDVFPEDGVDSREVGGVLLFVAPPGVYKVKLRTIKGKDVQLARATVTIGDAPPPPDPPTPPGPVDPLVAVLQAAYDQTPATEKPLKDKLAALYSQGAVWVENPTNAIPTWGVLFSKMAEVAASLGVSGKATILQTAIQRELKALFPVEDVTVLDVAGRFRAAEHFKRIAQALGRVK